MPRVKLTIGRVFNYLVATEPHWPRISSILLNFLLISTFFIRIRGGDYNASSGQNPAGAKTSSQSSHVSVACSPSILTYFGPLLLPEHRPPTITRQSPLSCAIPSSCFHVCPVLLMSFSSSRRQVFRGLPLFR